MDILAVTAEATAALKSHTVPQLVQKTLEANKSHQYALTKYAERLTAELADVDKLLNAADVDDEEGLDLNVGVQVAGAKRPTGPVLAGDLLRVDSPFFEEATRRMRYVNSTSVHIFKPRELQALTEAVKAEHRRLRAVEAQQAGQGIPDNNEDVDFDKNVEDLNWTVIAEKVTDVSGANIKRTAAECRVKWQSDKHPKINHNDWDSDEIDKLKTLVAPFMKAQKKVPWVEMAKELGTNRTPIDCMRHAVTRERHVWDEAADKKLAAAVKLYGKDNWNLVAVHVSQDATGYQCQMRYPRAFDATLKKGGWTAEEDARLTLAVAGYGVSWLEIAGTMAGRSNEQCRERWSEIESGPPTEPTGGRPRWTKEEDDALVKAVASLGHKWKAVGEELGGRWDGKQCRQRYVKLEKRLGLKTPAAAAGLLSMGDNYGNTIDGPAQDPQVTTSRNDAGDPTPKPKRKSRAKKATQTERNVNEAQTEAGSAAEDGTEVVKAPVKARPRPRPIGKGQEQEVVSEQPTSTETPSEDVEAASSTAPLPQLTTSKEKEKEVASSNVNTPEGSESHLDAEVPKPRGRKRRNGSTSRANETVTKKRRKRATRSPSISDNSSAVDYDAYQPPSTAAADAAGSSMVRRSARSRPA